MVPDAIQKVSHVARGRLLADLQDRPVPAMTHENFAPVVTENNPARHSRRESAVLLTSPPHDNVSASCCGTSPAFTSTG